MKRQWIERRKSTGTATGINEPHRQSGQDTILRQSVVCSTNGLMTAIVSSALLAMAALAVAEPLDGQITIDPQHPSALKRAGGSHRFICGPGDPEGFLYRGMRRSDGTRDGDQQQIIEHLIANGGNCLYLQVVRSHGGDGEPDHNPFIDADPTQAVDVRILDQWDEWFSQMDQHGILIYLFLYDDSARIWDTKDEVGREERSFIETIVRRFMRHKNLIWIVAEESEEAYSTERVHAIANVIQATDAHDHLIGNHHHSGTHFKSWREGGALNHFAMQLNVPIEEAHQGAIDALQRANGRYQVIYSENTAGEPTAKYAWECAMGGLMPMMLEMNRETVPVVEFQRCRALQQFFEATDFYRLEPADELASKGTKWVLSDRESSYLAYADGSSQPVGLDGVRVGEYQLVWLDCDTGVQVTKLRNVEKANATFPTPENVGTWRAVWIRLVGR